MTLWCDGQLLRAVSLVSTEECRQAVTLGPGLDSRPFRRAARVRILLGPCSVFHSAVCSARSAAVLR